MAAYAKPDQPDLRWTSPDNALHPLRRHIFCLCGALATIMVLAGTARPAYADFRLCNKTGGRVGVALGYKDRSGWITEGWWNLPTKACETLLRGTLVARYYYIYAIDYDRGGEWSGHAFMCTRDKEFTIRGTDDCLARGYDRTGFFEVDTGEQRSWTVQLKDAEIRATRPQASPGASAPSTPGQSDIAPPAPAPDPRRP